MAKAMLQTDFRCAHYMSNSQTTQSFFYFLRKITEKSAFPTWNAQNWSYIGPTLVQYYTS